ncbi:hypothetical protein F4X90_01700 [Candidatus Poribacteria bacterium]|nr:hypothetical protein [Candidatus Poribacteria bacterium]
MEIIIIIGLVLTILILFYLLIGKRIRVAEVAELQAALAEYKRKENGIIMREAEVTRLEAVSKQNRRKDSDVRKIEAEVVRLQAALDAEKRDKMRLQFEVIRIQNKRPPSNFKQEPPKICYTDFYWELLAAWYRQEQGWTCEKCGIDLSKRRYFLHTHHVYGRSWNDPEYLKALCIICHAEEHNNPDFMTKSSDYQRFLRTPEYQDFVKNRRIRQ